MITREEFSDIFKAMVVYASTPMKPEYVVAPSPANQQQGTKPLDTLPAQWWNWFLQEATTRFNGDRNLVGNMVAEIENLLSMFGIQADKESVTQLKDMFEKEYPEKILGEVRPLLDELKQEVDENITPKIESVSAKVEDIEVKIPEQASAENQLADKDFVNSSIATNTAYYIGNFDSLADLEAYTGTLTNNDYAFVTSVDSAGNLLYNRYKYNEQEAQWVFEYSLNNTGFTAEQMAAINSRITSGMIPSNASSSNKLSTASDLSSKFPVSIANGGTGKTTAYEALNALMQGMPDTYNVQDNEQILAQRVNNGTCSKYTFAEVWKWIQRKMASEVGSTIYYAGTKYNTMKVTNSNGLLTFTFE